MRHVAVDAVGEEVAGAVFQLLTNHVTGGEIEKVKHTLPEEIRALWPEPVRVMAR